MHINVITPGALEKALSSEKAFRWLSHKDFEVPFMRTVLNGFEDHLKQNYPECCGFHQNLSTNAVAYLHQFPNCCQDHKKLAGANFFNKEKAIKGMVEKIIETARQTEVVIGSKIDEPDAYAHITEFIEYAIESFGQPPAGYGGPIGLPVYTSHLKSYFKVFRNKLPADTAKSILDFLMSYESKAGPTKVTDINDLMDIYNKWIATFPWEMSFFKGQKAFFSQRMPLLGEKPITNRYSGLSKAKLIRVEELIKFLVESTKLILKTFNSRTLKEGFKASDLELKEIEVINAQRDQELVQLGENITDERKKYFKILNQWFEGEQRYLRKIIPSLERMETRKAAAEREKAPAHKPVDLHSLENKFCARMPISFAIDHFANLVNFNSSNGKPFLTQPQLEDFIGAAFAKVPIKIKHRINFTKGETGMIRGLFYAFYRQAVDNLYELNTQCKYKYVQLLTEHMEGWDENKVKDNFRAVSGPWN